MMLEIARAILEVFIFISAFSLIALLLHLFFIYAAKVLVDSMYEIDADMERRKRVRELKKELKRHGRKLKPVKGKKLDAIAAQYGVKRKAYWWIFKESDKHLRGRIIQRLRTTPFERV